MPETTTGRIAAVMIMLTGVAVLGLLAGTLASFFRLQPAESPSAAAGGDGRGQTNRASNGPETGLSAPGMDQVLTDLTELRAQVAELTTLKTQLELLTVHLGQGGTQDHSAATMSRHRAVKERGATAAGLYGRHTAGMR